MSALWTRKDAMAATKGGFQGGDWQASGLSIDSRTVAKGDLFIALTGPHHDGHDHVQSALEKGAVAAMVHRITDAVAKEAPLLIVGDTLDGLRDLAAFARHRSKAKVVGVTGSVGKTGTKEMLRLALGGETSSHASVGSFNNHWGVPLSVARLPVGFPFAVFELGMNHAGEITPLTRLVRPDIAIITTVEAVHLEFFESVRGIAEAKAEIFQGVGSHGCAILPRDNPYYDLLAERARAAGIGRILTFGTHIDADARLLDFAVTPDATLVFALLGDKSLSYRIGVPGRPWAINSLAVLLAAREAGVELETAAAALAHLPPPKGRGARNTLSWGEGSLVVIDDSYNASPVSVRAALTTLGSFKPGKQGRRIAVLGDMLELGGEGPSLHRSLAETAIAANIDLVFTAGPLMAYLHDALPPERRGAHAEDSAALAPLVGAALRAGDLVMVKGSAGSRMNKIVTYLEEQAAAVPPAANGH